MNRTIALLTAVVAVVILTGTAAAATSDGGSSAVEVIPLLEDIIAFFEGLLDAFTGTSSTS